MSAKSVEKNTPATEDLVDDIRIKGSYMKIKTKKMKYFILRDETDKERARLEYFQDEKSFQTNPTRPRRSIILKDCLDINKGIPKNVKPSTSTRFSMLSLDTGKSSSTSSSSGSYHSSNYKKHILQLFTHKDVFKIGYPSETVQEEWFVLMLQLRSKSIQEGTLTNDFEHVWPVKLLPQSSGCGQKMKCGHYHFCLNNKFINLIKVAEREEECVKYTFALSEIKKIGDTEQYFTMTMGSGSSVGEGILWFQVDDPSIAKNMHQIIYNAMVSKERRTTISIPGPGGSNHRSIIKIPKVKSNKATSQSLKTENSNTPPKGPLSTTPDGQMTGSSSKSSVYSSSSSQPSGPCHICSNLSFHYDDDPGYLRMDPSAASHISDLPDTSFLRTISVGNKQQYQYARNSGLREDEKASSAPHLKDGDPGGEDGGGEAGAAVGGGGNGDKSSSSKPPKPSSNATTTATGGVTYRRNTTCSHCSDHLHHASASSSFASGVDHYGVVNFEPRSTIHKRESFMNPFSNSKSSRQKMAAQGKLEITDPARKALEYQQTLIRNEQRRHEEFRPRIQTAPSIHSTVQEPRKRADTYYSAQSGGGGGGGLTGGHGSGGKGGRSTTTRGGSSFDEENQDYVGVDLRLQQRQQQQQQPGFNKEEDGSGYVMMNTPSVTREESNEEEIHTTYEHMSFEPVSPLSIDSTNSAATSAATTSSSTSTTASGSGTTASIAITAGSRSGSDRNSTNSDVFSSPPSVESDYLEMRVVVTTATAAAATRTSSSSTNSPLSSTSSLSSSSSIVPVAASSTTTLTFNEYLPMNFNRNKSPQK